MGSESLVSIVVPVYNAEQYLKRCIDSIITQTYQNIEIILVDDGSFDRSPEFCDQYAQSNSFVRVIHKQNEGPSLARASGLQVANGRYIAFVDADDYMEPEMIITMIANFHDDVDIVECGYFVLVGYIFSNIISFAELYLLKINLIFMVFIRRMIYVPINLNFLYYKSFFNDDKLYFKQGVFLFSKLWNTSYENSYIYKICNDWFNGLTFSPNNGMFSEAYSQIGLLGIFVFPIIIYIYIKQFAKFFNILNDDGISFMFSIVLLSSMSNVFILSFRIT